MIEINLLPEDQRVKKAAAAPSQLENAVFIIPVILIVVIVIHLYLGIVYMSRKGVYAGLEKKWSSLEPQKKEILGLKNEIDAFSADARIVEGFMKGRIELAPKINKLSMHLPPGIWFNDVSYGRRQLVVRASVVSLKIDEMDIINTFVEDLKSDNDFSEDFGSIDVGAVVRRTVGSYDVVDFVLTAPLASKD